MKTFIVLQMKKEVYDKDEYRKDHLDKKGSDLYRPLKRLSGALFLGILSLFPASELATYLLQMFLTWIFPPRVLPKLSFEEEGIPDDCRTLVVVPMMLLTPASIRGDIERLEVRFFEVNG